eukprot:COSAG02_NODE_2208_length_9500_cov_13.043400_3_plen_119_part_00
MFGFVASTYGFKSFGRLSGSPQRPQAKLLHYITIPHDLRLAGLITIAGVILVSGSLASLLAMPALSWTISTGGDFETVNFFAMLLGLCSLYLPAFCYSSERKRASAVAGGVAAAPAAP